jgi:hypothetical protein
MDRHGAAHGIDGGGEFNQETLAGGLDHATAMLGDGRVQNVRPRGVQRDQARIADHVRGEYRR